MQLKLRKGIVICFNDKIRMLYAYYKCIDNNFTTECMDDNVTVEIYF